MGLKRKRERERERESNRSVRFTHKLLIGALVTMMAVPVVSMPAYAASLHDRIVNGSMENFSYGRVSSIASPPASADTYIDVNGGRFYYTSYGNAWYKIPNWNRSAFGWSSTQPGGTWDGFEVPKGTVQINYDIDTHNAYAELSIHTESAIYQDVATEPLSVYKWTLKHSSLSSAYDDSMSVMIGAPGRETAQRAKRVKSNGGGSSLGDVGTIIKTHNRSATSNRVASSWETYEGTYLVPVGQTTTRFTFKAVDSYSPTGGNNLDDIEFAISHPVNFNSNGGSDIGFNPTANNYAGYVMEGGTGSLSSMTSKKPTRSGYTFLGWSESKMSPFTSYDEYAKNKGRITNTVSMGTKAKTVYAVWGKNPTMTFNNQGSKHWSTAVSFGGTTKAPSSPTRTGYTFGGWSPAIPSNVYSNWVTSAIWNPNTYKLTYVKNAPSGSTGGDSNVTLSKSSQTAKYDSPWGALATASKPGYTFKGWYTSPSGGTRVTSDTVVKGNLTVYAHWAPVEYTIRFNGNGDMHGCDVTGSMASIKVKYDQMVNLPANKFKATVTVPAEDDGGETVVKPSVFKGWNQNPGSLKSSLADKASVMNLTSKGGAVVDLYAVWDNAPMFVVEQYPDRYFTLEEAHNGVITEEELLKTVIVKDRETNPLPHKTTQQVESGDDVGVSIVGWDASEFTDMTDDGVVSIRYKVKDESGNEAYLNIEVYITGNGPLPRESYDFYRAISKEYEGTLPSDSRWLNDYAYQQLLEDAFSGESKTHSYSIDGSMLEEIRDYVDVHGMGNSGDADALNGLLGSFRD